MYFSLAPLNGTLTAQELLESTTLSLLTFFWFLLVWLNVCAGVETEEDFLLGYILLTNLGT